VRDGRAAPRRRRRARTLALVSVLYALEASPALFHLQAPAHGFPRTTACALLAAALGLALETVADCQKARFKLRLTRAQRESPTAALFTGGLFSRCRRPNYAGVLRAAGRGAGLLAVRASHALSLRLLV
jgi:steroid 5-alpha reductase family enzyme